MVGLLLGCQHANCWILAKVTCKKTATCHPAEDVNGSTIPQLFNQLENAHFTEMGLDAELCLVLKFVVNFYMLYIYILHNIYIYRVLQPCTFCNPHFKPYSIDAASPTSATGQGHLHWA